MADPPVPPVRRQGSDHTSDEGPPGDAELVQRVLGRQVRLLDDPDDLELLGCGIPHSSSPHPRSCFFEQAVFERQVGRAFLQGTGFAAQILHLAGGRSTSSIIG